jgi:hypothetical protein
MSPVNHYFQSGTNIGTSSEQFLIEDLIIESIKIYGFDLLYLPRTSIKQDDILGEDILSQFTQLYPVEGYLKNPSGWDGSSELMSKFGIQVHDECTFVISQRRWDQAVAQQTNDLQLPTRPAEGDLIYFAKTRSFFEIKFVENKNPFYQIGKLYVWDLQCELYQYSSEPIQTYDADINDFVLGVDRNAYAWPVRTQSGGALLTQSGGVVIQEAFPDDANAFDNTTDFDTESATLIDFDVNNPFGEI